MLYYDAVAYGAEELALVERVIARANNYEGRDEREFSKISPLRETGLTMD